MDNGRSAACGEKLVNDGKAASSGLRDPLVGHDGRGLASGASWATGHSGATAPKSRRIPSIRHRMFRSIASPGRRDAPQHSRSVSCCAEPAVLVPYRIGARFGPVGRTGRRAAEVDPAGAGHRGRLVEWALSSTSASVHTRVQGRVCGRVGVRFSLVGP